MHPNDQNTVLADINAALDWWRQAGVDCDFQDEPQQWILAPDSVDQAEPVDPNSFPAVKIQLRAAVVPTRAMIGGDRATWPTDLAAFADWWRHEPSLDGGQIRDRVPPRGPLAPPLMVLVCEPEVGDSDSLLSGPQGRLLAAMLAAMGLPADQVYFASALPRQMPMADWDDLAAQGLGDVLRHHVALVRPRRLIAFGRHIPTLLRALPIEPALAGNGPAQTAPDLPIIRHDDGDVAILVARDLASLLERPIAKGNFWQRWLEWSRDGQANRA